MPISLVELGRLKEDVLKCPHSAVAGLNVRWIINPPFVLSGHEVLDYLRQIDLDLGSLVVSKLLDACWV